jgi:hypothetical protein
MTPFKLFGRGKDGPGRAQSAVSPMLAYPGFCVIHRVHVRSSPHSVTATMDGEMIVAIL